MSHESNTTDPMVQPVNAELVTEHQQPALGKMRKILRIATLIIWLISSIGSMFMCGWGWAGYAIQLYELAVIVISVSSLCAILRSYVECGLKANTVTTSIVLMIVVGLSFLQLNAMRQARDAALHTIAVNNFKQLILATHQCHSINRVFPSDQLDAAGNPVASWRVSILPFLELDPITELSQNETPFVFKRSGVEVESGKTVVQRLVGPGTVFSDPRKQVGFRDIEETGRELSEYPMLVEVPSTHATSWEQPGDVTIKEMLSHLENPWTVPRKDHYLVGYADGFVDSVTATELTEILRAMQE